MECWCPHERARFDPCNRRDERMRGMLINDPNVGILCPQSSTPMHPLHSQRIEWLNRAYEAMDKDDDGESPDDQRKVYDAFNGPRDDWMRLYVETKITPHQARTMSVTSAYYRCQVCGFVLPVTVS